MREQNYGHGRIRFSKFNKKYHLQMPTKHESDTKILNGQVRF